MAIAVNAPRLNANEDEVVIQYIAVKVGDQVKAGDVIFDVETSKSVLSVETENDGYVIELCCEVGDVVHVGKVMAWIGSSPDEIPPALEMKTQAIGSEQNERLLPTLKAMDIAQQNGLDVSVIPFGGERITADDVRRYLERQPANPKQFAKINPPLLNVSTLPQGIQEVPLSITGRAVAATVTWHRDQAVAAYLETSFEQVAWKAHSQDFAAKHGLIMDPLLGLLAYRLVQLSKEVPVINSFFENGKLYQYDSVHIGFTMEVKEQLYMLVVRDAHKLDALEFLHRLSELQRQAFRQRLKPEESSGATIAFTSLAKYAVSRHIPVLAPRTALIVAHSATILEEHSTMLLGATYDHRVLNGSAVARTLLNMKKFNI